MCRKVSHKKPHPPRTIQVYPLMHLLQAMSFHVTVIEEIRHLLSHRVPFCSIYALFSLVIDINTGDFSVNVVNMCILCYMFVLRCINHPLRVCVL